MSRKRQSRFRLLPYKALSKRWFLPALLLIPGGVALWWATPNLPLLDPRLAPLAIVISGIGTLIAIYTLLARRAHISCHKNRLVIHTPFYPVAFSYSRIEMIRPVLFHSIFPVDQQKASRRNLYRHIWGKTVIVATLKSYPLPLWWLRLWFHPFLLHPQEKALVLPVEDWMALSRRIESLRSNWRDARQRR